MKKAQYGGPIAYILMVLVFIVLWAVWLGPWLVTVGQQAIIDGPLVGFEAFFYANLNLWVMLGLILGTLGWFYWSAQA